MEHPRNADSPRRAAPAAALVASLLAGLLAGCSSSKTSKGIEEEVPMEELDVVSIQTEDLEIGEFLAKADLAMRAWTSLTNTANTPAERTQARQLEDFLRNETENRQGELIAQLETGPPFNRIRAASALGFTDEAALSPLVAALADGEQDVVHNALLGLALLALPQTPLEDVCELLRNDEDPHVRSNAAYALRSIVEAGGSGSCVVPAARRGLLDPEPLVQVQSALVLGLSEDTESIEALTDLAYDETPLVARAAIESLVIIARRDAAQRGPVARALLPALEEAPRKTRPMVKAALVQVAEGDHGEYEDWVKWARDLP